MLDKLGFVASQVWRRNAVFFVGAGLAIAAVSLLKKPLRSLAVATTRETLDISDRVTSAAGLIKHKFSGIVEEAREEIKADAARKNAASASSSMEQKVEVKENECINNKQRLDTSQFDL